MLIFKKLSNFFFQMLMSDLVGLCWRLNDDY